MARKKSFKKAHEGFKHVPMNDQDGTTNTPNNSQRVQNQVLNNMVNSSSSSVNNPSLRNSNQNISDVSKGLGGAALGLGGAYLLYKGVKGLAGKIKESPRFQGSLLGTSNEPRLAAKAERNKLRLANKNRRFATNKDGSLKPGFVKTTDGSIERELTTVSNKIKSKPAKPIPTNTPEKEINKAELTKSQQRKSDRANKSSDKMMEKDIKKSEQQKQRLADFDAGKGRDFRRSQRLKKQAKKRGEKKEKQSLKDAGIFKSKKRYDKLKKKADAGNKKAQAKMEMLDPKTGRPPTFKGGNKAQFAAGALLAAAAPVLKKAAVSAVANVAAKKIMPEKEAAKGFKTIINNLPSGSSNRK